MSGEASLTLKGASWWNPRGFNEEAAAATLFALSGHVSFSPSHLPLLAALSLDDMLLVIDSAWNNTTCSRLCRVLQRSAHGLLFALQSDDASFELRLLSSLISKFENFSAVCDRLASDTSSTDEQFRRRLRGALFFATASDTAAQDGWSLRQWLVSVQSATLERRKGIEERFAANCKMYREMLCSNWAVSTPPSNADGTANDLAGKGFALASFGRNTIRCSLASQTSSPASSSSPLTPGLCAARLLSMMFGVTANVKVDSREALLHPNVMGVPPSVLCYVLAANCPSLKQDSAILHMLERFEDDAASGSKESGRERRQLTPTSFRIRTRKSSMAPQGGQRRRSVAIIPSSTGRPTDRSYLCIGEDAEGGGASLCSMPFQTMMGVQPSAALVAPLRRECVALRHYWHNVATSELPLPTTTSSPMPPQFLQQQEPFSPLSPGSPTLLEGLQLCEVVAPWNIGFWSGAGFVLQAPGVGPGLPGTGRLAPGRCHNLNAYLPTLLNQTEHPLGVPYTADAVAPLPPSPLCTETTHYGMKGAQDALHAYETWAMANRAARYRVITGMLHRATAVSGAGEDALCGDLFQVIAAGDSIGGLWGPAATCDVFAAQSTSTTAHLREMVGLERMRDLFAILCCESITSPRGCHDDLTISAVSDAWERFLDVPFLRLLALDRHEVATWMAEDPTGNSAAMRLQVSPALSSYGLSASPSPSYEMHTDPNSSNRSRHLNRTTSFTPSISLLGGDRWIRFLHGHGTADTLLMADDIGRDLRSSSLRRTHMHGLGLRPSELLVLVSAWRMLRQSSARSIDPAVILSRAAVMAAQQQQPAAGDGAIPELSALLRRCAQHKLSVVARRSSVKRAQLVAFTGRPHLSLDGSVFTKPHGAVSSEEPPVPGSFHEILGGLSPMMNRRDVIIHPRVVSVASSLSGVTTTTIAELLEGLEGVCPDLEHIDHDMLSLIRHLLPPANSESRGDGSSSSSVLPTVRVRNRADPGAVKSVVCSDRYDSRSPEAVYHNHHRNHYLAAIPLDSHEAVRLLLTDGARYAAAPFEVGQTCVWHANLRQVHACVQDRWMVKAKAVVGRCVASRTRRLLESSSTHVAIPICDVDALTQNVADALSWSSKLPLQWGGLSSAQQFPAKYTQRFSSSLQPSLRQAAPAPANAATAAMLALIGPPSDAMPSDADRWPDVNERIAQLIARPPDGVVQVHALLEATRRSLDEQAERASTLMAGLPSRILSAMDTMRQAPRLLHGYQDAVAADERNNRMEALSAFFKSATDALRGALAHFAESRVIVPAGVEAIHESLKKLQALQPEAPDRQMGQRTPRGTTATRSGVVGKKQAGNAAPTAHSPSGDFLQNVSLEIEEVRAANQRVQAAKAELEWIQSERARAVSGKEEAMRLRAEMLTMLEEKKRDAVQRIQTKRSRLQRELDSMAKDMEAQRTAYQSVLQMRVKQAESRLKALREDPAEFTAQLQRSYADRIAIIEANISAWQEAEARVSAERDLLLHSKIGLWGGTSSKTNRQSLRRLFPIGFVAVDASDPSASSSIRILDPLQSDMMIVSSNEVSNTRPAALTTRESDVEERTIRLRLPVWLDDELRYATAARNPSAATPSTQGKRRVLAFHYTIRLTGDDGQAQ